MQTTPHDDFGRAVNHLARVLRQRMARAVAPLGLTSQQAAVILTLSDAAVPVSTVADHLGIERPTMTGMAERLTRDGWITLSANPQDRRSKLVSLTPRARGALPALRQAATEVNDAALGVLDGSDRERLLALLGRLEKELDV